MVKYTKAQLEIQLKLTNAHLLNAQNDLVRVNGPEWTLAIVYGESIRANHIETLNHNIVFYRKRIAETQAQIAAM